MAVHNGAESAARALMRRLDVKGGKDGAKEAGKESGKAGFKTALRRIDVAELSIERRRNGRGFIYMRGGRHVRDERLLSRLKRLAVPPAYEAVRYAESPNAHIQAIGRDAAGRVQYRYHPDWDRLREQRKARRLKELLRALPAIRRALGRYLRDKEFTREFALAAVIDLIALTALRPGSEVYAREHGTRGAATLLKSDVTLHGERIALKFRGKGGKLIEREVRSRRLAKAIRKLQALPGKRLFQYRTADGRIAVARRRDANDFLHDIASADISLKDFRTLTACARALENLVKLEPKPSDAGRRRQLKECFCAVSEELANTPAICRKSYVHAVVVKSFESGALQALAKHKAAGGEAMLRALLDSTGAR